jgi:hypothetical protein
MEAWLKKGGFFIAIRALRTGIDFFKVIYIIHIRVLYRLIDFI